MKISLIQGDITVLKVDAIVNAANSSLLGGGGVDGAIHRAAGPQLLEACRVIRNRQGGCKVGAAVITPAGQLQAKFVIHTVGPKWNDGRSLEKEKLRNCYLNVLRLAAEHKCKTIAIPNISTGIYRFPKRAAAVIAIDTIRQSEWFLGQEIIFVCFDKENFQIYQDLLKED